jgi:predicted N-acetyltransferase YhbS
MASATPMKLDLSEPRTEEELEAYYRLRYERLRKPHGLAPGSERDHPAEAGSSHLVAKADGRTVGAVCWAVGMRKDEESGRRHVYVRLRQLAVDPEFEGMGIGTALTRHVEQAARALGAEEVVVSVRVERAAYFERLGYAGRGKGETLFGTVEHSSMAKKLQ